MPTGFKTFDFITIRNRPEIEIEVDGRMEKIIDLTENIVSYEKALQVQQQPIVVTKELQGRPDLISRMVYGSEDYTDLLLTFNGIPNPWMVVEGMVITIFDLESMKANIKDLSIIEANNVSKSKFNEKLPEKDKKRIKAMQKKNADGGIEEDDFRTPTMVKEGTVPITPVDGRIVLGTNVSDVRCKDEISPVQTLTEKIREAVKDKIKSQQVEGATIPAVKGNNKIKLSDTNNLLKRDDNQPKSSEFKKRSQ